MKVLYTFDPINPEILDAFEQQHSFKLPEDYRAFLLQHNGGKPVPGVFDFQLEGKMNSDRVDWLLGFHESADNTFKNYFGYNTRVMPHNLLPIAIDPEPNIICMSIRGEDYGKIYWWDSDWATPSDNPDYSNVHFIANNFTEFLNMLYEFLEE